MSYIKGTYLEELIDRTIDNWAILLGFAEEERSRHDDGTFKGDDLSTSDVNEAWKTGKRPKKVTVGKSKKTKKRLM